MTKPATSISIKISALSCYIVSSTCPRAFLKLCYLPDILGQDPWDNLARDQRRVLHVDRVFSGDRSHIQLALANPVGSMVQDYEKVAIEMKERVRKTE